MKASDYVNQSKYLKSEQLGNRRVTCTIETLSEAIFEDGNKPILHFVGKSKGLVCNTTKLTVLASLYGDDMQGWLGKQIVLAPDQVSYQGKMYACITVSGPVNTAAIQQSQPQGFSAPEAPGHPDNPVGQSFVPSEPAEDDVPF